MVIHVFHTIGNKFWIYFVEIEKVWAFSHLQKKSSGNDETSIFLKNGKQGLQTVRLDELNNIVTWANISFIFQN